MTTRRERRAAARGAKTGGQVRFPQKLWKSNLSPFLLVAASVIAWIAWRQLGAPSLVRDGAPSWSPDGRRLAFYSEREGRPADLFVVDTSGANERRLTSTPAAEGYPSWSPNGERLAFESHAADGNFDIYVMQADGSNVVRLTTDPKRDVAPAWSPDGLKIVFMSNRVGPEFDLFVMNADGGDQQPLTKGETDWFPQYSTDGTQIAFHRWRDVHVIDVASRTIRRLTTDPANGMYPSWSPDSRRLAFMSWRRGRTEVFTMNADGSDQRVLVSMPTGDAIDPRWSPDGTSIAFVHSTGAMLDSADAAGLPRIIYLADAQTGAIRRLR